MTSKKTQWSAYQKAVFHHVKKQGGHAVVQGVAGCGKTTTISRAITHTYEDDQVYYAAFNTDVMKAMARKLPRGVHGATIHSFAYRALRPLGIELEPTDQIGFVAKAVARAVGFGKQQAHDRAAVRRLVSISKSMLLDSSEALGRIAAGLYLRHLSPLSAASIAVEVRKQSLQHTMKSKQCSFDDMIWLHFALDKPLPYHRWIGSSLTKRRI